MMSLHALILKAFLRLLGRLPLRVHYALGSFVAFLAEHVLHYRRQEVAINLARCFPDRKYPWLREQTHLFYKHFGEIIAETVWFGACRGPERLRRGDICEVVNPEVLQHLYDVAPSVLVVYTHCGNWELLGGLEYYNLSGAPFPVKRERLCVVYKRMSSKTWDRIMADNRMAPLVNRKELTGYVESNDVMRYALRHRDEKLVLNFNTDQSPYNSTKAKVDLEFLHQPTRAMTGAASLASHMGYSVAYMSMRRIRRGRYQIEYTPICENASTMTPEDITRQYYALLEKDINAQPFNYLWSHRRWKDDVIL